MIGKERRRTRTTRVSRQINIITIKNRGKGREREGGTGTRDHKHTHTRVATPKHNYARCCLRPPLPFFPGPLSTAAPLSHTTQKPLSTTNRSVSPPPPPPFKKQKPRVKAKPSLAPSYRFPLAATSNQRHFVSRGSERGKGANTLLEALKPRHDVVEAGPLIWIVRPASLHKLGEGLGTSRRDARTFSSSQHRRNHLTRTMKGGGGDQC